MAFAQTLLRKMLSDSISEKHYDIFFVVQTTDPETSSPVETRLGAHRVVLSAVSDEFESSSNHSEINVTQCSPAAVREALEIIYGGDMRESQHSIVLALEIWHFGVIFQVHHLIQLARSSCLDNLSTENCLRILDFAVQVNDVQVVDNLQNYASENANFSHVIASPHFDTLHFDVISSLVRPGKGECAWPEILTFEKVWFDALVKWLASRIHDNQHTQDNPNIPLIQKLLDLIDFTRMKTHELREISAHPIPLNSPTFASQLVSVLLTRSEQLESTILERNIDLDVIGQKYQQALAEADEAARNSRAAAEKLETLHSTKISLERRVDELRRRKSPGTNPTSVPRSRRKVSGSSTII